MINVYWACIEEEWFRAKEPTSVFKEVNDNHKIPPFSFCPAYRQTLSNVFSVKSIYDYEFVLNNDQIQTNMYDQDFANKHLFYRDLNTRLFSFLQYYIFFTEEKSLEMSVLPPFMDNNNVTERCTIVPGTFDIGKWYRNIEFAFMLKPQHNTFKIDEEENYYYLKFHTNEKINFIQYRNSELLDQYRKDVLFSKNNARLKPGGLNAFYKMFRTKKLILNEIKKNMLC